MRHDLPILAARLREMHRAVERRQRRAAALLEAELHPDHDEHDLDTDEDDDAAGGARR